VISHSAGERSLALTCEVCGNPIRTAPARVEIDGAVLRVCQGCAKRGTPLGAPPRTGSLKPRVIERGWAEPEFDIDPEYDLLVRRAREKMGLTQEALGRMINVKPSVISHIETRKMKPDIVLARTLMHYLKVDLLVPTGDFESGA
jgi:putative transcription factor